MVRIDSYVSASKINQEKKVITGSIAELETEKFYKIENYDAMPPFLMSIVSNSDHWMYISSSGGLTAGRKNADLALFPYYTDDKIHESAENSGGKTIVRVKNGNKTLVWEPFSDHCKGLYRCSNNLYKSITGNRIIFEEINHDLGLSIQTGWMNSVAYGWVRQTTLKNLKDSLREIRVLDGIHNIMPYGILKNVQDQFSTLMDAYKRSELHKGSGLGIFSMSSIPVDRAEPSESLRATTVWHTAGNIENILLGTSQLDRFRNGESTESEYDKRGVRGAYLLVKDILLQPGNLSSHLIVAEVNQDHRNVNNLLKEIKNGSNTEEKIFKDIDSGTKTLTEMVKRSDGIQNCADQFVSARHFSNVLFNIMRGGIYADDYTVRRNDLVTHVRRFNTNVADRFRGWFDQLNPEENYSDLVKRSAETGDPDLHRIVLEYLPLTFSRRHGDPSRPWNRFSINIRNADGSRSLNYEGNWRDIFQNWEALSFSYPEYLEGIISKFLNASTVDGYNPYRITSNGIDWETFDPSDPWSFIGYWGDHQIIYLLKLMELQEKFFPGRLVSLMDQSIFTFVNVPYRIKPYEEIIKDPDRTIDFDHELHVKLLKKSNTAGADGKLLCDENDKIIRTNLIDKLLITLLTKLSNFIPGAGIWMNTQRPEWNDANNALVGNGVSMVTLYYLRRFTKFMDDLLTGSEIKELRISSRTSEFLQQIHTVFSSHIHTLDEKSTGSIRKKMTDLLGMAGSSYRQDVYNYKHLEMTSVSRQDINNFLQLVLRYLDHSIEENQRTDKLFHAYNLIKIENNSIPINRLPAMLEGQVAVLSSGFLGPNRTIEVLEALRKSKLYRKDQHSYMLYPDKDLPGFLEKNNIQEKDVANYPVIQKLIKEGGLNLVSEDQSGNIHFDGDLKNKNIIKERIAAINSSGDIKISEDDEKMLLDLYESLFNHHAFTGRSGSFFKYEGLGSIYWHMVSKLQLTIAENIQRFKTNAGKEKISRLRTIYDDIREGIGVHKNPADYGAIPTDPYSHTPSMMGAQQPGMTGQVKEDIISRWFEMGIEVHDGKIVFHPDRINKKDLDMQGELSFTLCGTPVRYTPGLEFIILLVTANEDEIVCYSGEIERDHSQGIFARKGDVKEIRVIYKNEK
ncbi:MAG: hypothetical protein K9J30_11305 [Bacteroidales bacterium]|nr:hypothetical protein [Bacteroidales bacterium]